MTPHRFPPSRCTILVALAVSVATSVAAQEPTRSPSPPLLRRLAEAVDGHRTGRPVWVVASHDSLNPVRGVLSDRPSADRLARRLGSSYDVFGPYLSPRELASAYMVVNCVHDGTVSIMTPYCPGPIIPRQNVDSMSLTIFVRGGATRRMPIDPGVDAVFLSLPAIDKFAIPYYSRVVGIEAAAAMRSQIAQEITRLSRSATIAPEGRAP